MNVLVTGGAGYIGSHTVSKLVVGGYNVVVYDNLSTGFRDAVPQGVKIVEGDVLDTALLAATLHEYKIDAVIHFAAKLVVPDSVVNPIDYYENNVSGVISLVQACRKSSVSKIVFSSTASLYGNGSLNNFLTENCQIDPLNPYARSKFMSEQILQDAQRAYGFKIVVLRYFNVAGAALDGSNGQRTKNATHLIKVASEVACGKRNEISIFGMDYPTYDGTCVRDYIHIEDLADIHVHGVRFLDNDRVAKLTVLNCGYGNGYSVKQVLEAMKTVSGTDFTIRVSERRLGDGASLIADSSKLRDVLGWSPKYNSLSLICKTALEWERKS